MTFDKNGRCLALNGPERAQTALRPTKSYQVLEKKMQRLTCSRPSDEADLWLGTLANPAYCSFTWSFGMNQPVFLQAVITEPFPG